MKLEKDETIGSGKGMSRAAKKRAKKKRKESSKIDSKRAPSYCNGDEHRHHDNTPKKGDIGADGNRKRRKSTGEKKIPSEMDVEQKHVQPQETPFCPDVSVSEILRLRECKDKSIAQQLDEMTATQRASFLFQAILAPITLEEFYRDYFEKKPLVVTAGSKKNKSRFSELLSLEGIRDLTRNHSMYYGRDLNVTKYKKGTDGVKRRFTLDKISEDDDDNDDDHRGVQVENSELWSNYENGCTVRLLCPHKHNDAIQSLLSTLELEFNCMVGANAYLTPPRSSQGFAPHYDDIDAYCLQLQGSKRWKVYKPTLQLPRTSSEDFTAKDLEKLKLVLDVTLEEGDLLYMPRGWIHQAYTLTDIDQHSLHLTISSMQQWAWIDLMDIAVPEALAAASESESSVSLREGLPKGFLDYMGVQYERTPNDKLPESLRHNANEEFSEINNVKLQALHRENFKKEAKKRIMEIAKTACEMLDASCDEIGKRFLSERQPPALTASEAALNSEGAKMADENPILPNTMCRLLRPGIARLVIEDDKAVIYHCFDNSREYHMNPISPLEFEMEDGPALEQLLTTVEPNWIFVNDLFHDTIEDKIQITQALYDEGIIAMKTAEDAVD